jgi:IstB-like ATP binding protein
MICSSRNACYFVIKRRFGTSAQSGIAFGTGYPPGRSPPAIEKRAAAPWITLRGLFQYVQRTSQHKNWPTPTVAQVQFQITYTNLVFSEWERIFKDPMTTLAAIDRVVHHSVVLDLMSVESYRAKAAGAKPTASPSVAA